MNKGNILNLRYYFDRLKEAKKTIFLDFSLFVLAAVLVPVIGAVMPKFFIASILEKNNLRFIFYFAAFFIVSCLSGFSMAYYQTRNEDLINFLTFKLVEKIQHLAMTIPYKETENPAVLDQLQAARGSVQNETGRIYQSSAAMLSHGMALAVYMVLILSVQPLLLIFLIFNVSVNLFFSQKAKDFSFSQRDEKAAITRKKDYVFQLMFQYQYGKEIRSYQSSNWILSIFDYYKDLYKDLNRKIQKKALLASIIEVLLTFVREGLAYLILVQQFLANNISLDQFVMMFGIVASFAVAAQSFIVDYTGLRDSLKHFGKFREFIDQWEQAEKSPGKKGTFPFETIEFRNVSFKYPNSKKQVLSHFSYTIQQGRHIAIVGVNGAGKTTLVKLLCRLYEDYEGEILVNGAEIRTFDREWYWDQISAVFQDFQILAADVSENIAISEDTDEGRIWNSLFSAGLAEKVRSLPETIHTQMSKNLYDSSVELSGGEKQKLAIARSVYHGGSLLILDEPTAALDPLAESEIYEKMQEWAEGKTAVFISHRLNSTKFCDEILVMKDGRILEQGTHQELYAKGGVYTEMFQTQAKYYLDEKEMKVI